MNPKKPGYVGAVEAGGTKFTCALASLDGQVQSSATIPTRGPVDTLGDVISFFSGRAEIRALGLGAFGPVILDPTSKDFGVIQHSSKLQWRRFPILDYLRRGLSVPVSLATDVEVAALGEARTGAARGLSDFAYVTIGTGIGCAMFRQGKPVRGHTHAELGHYFPQRNDLDADFSGVCPYHGDCLEGLASGPAIENRLHIKADMLPCGHPFWAVEADYIAQLCVVISLAMSPDRIILGGGVLRNDNLLSLVRKSYVKRMSGYAVTDQSTNEHSFIARPLSPEGSGLAGAISMALDIVNTDGVR